MSDTRRKLIERVEKFVKEKFGDDWRAAFAAFDDDNDGRISSDEAHQFLSQAGEGSWWVREIAVRQMIRVGDLNADGKLSFVEFLAIISNGHGEEPGEGGE